MKTTKTNHVFSASGSMRLAVITALIAGLGSLFAGTASAHAALAADRLIVANQQCGSDGMVKVSLNWTTASQGEQWLDVSRTPDNFVSGALFSFGPWTSQRTDADISLMPRTTYYARINTQADSSWYGSSTLAFSTQACEGVTSSSGGIQSGGVTSGGGDSGAGGGMGGY